MSTLVARPHKATYVCSTSETPPFSVFFVVLPFLTEPQHFVGILVPNSAVTVHLTLSSCTYTGFG